MLYSGGGEKNLMRLPDSITKRNMLHGVKTSSPESLTAMGRGFEEKGQYSDAADFYAVAKNTNELQRLETLAASLGDTFLLLKLFRLASKELDAGILEQCAQKAESLAKIRFAIMAYERLGKDKKVAELKEQISGDLDIQAEARAAEVFIPISAEEIDEE